MSLDPEEATRLCVSAVRMKAHRLAECYNMDCGDFDAVADALESGDLRIVPTDLLRTLQKAGVLVAVESDGGRTYEPTALCQRLIDKVAPGEEVIVSSKRLAALEKVVEAANGVRDSDNPLKNGCGCDGSHGHPDYPPPKNCRAWAEKGLADALAELDALEGGRT